MRDAVQPVKLLMVEDNAADVMLTQELLSESKVMVSMEVVNDGAEALAYLRREPPFTNAILPDLVLLDLNLPKINGHQVLKEIKNDPELKHLPVIILTTSQAETDIRSAYADYAAAYITKPVDLEQFSTVVQAIEGFWFSVVKLPAKPDQ
jgi:CheY-like chemotaxis protein